MRAASRLVMVLTLVVVASPAQAGDLGAIPRAIKKQPAYQSEPKFALVVLGEKQETRMWMALDRSSSDAPQFDVLYIDLNGDGDLTDSRERVTAESSNGNTTRFAMPALVDPNSGAKHTEFSLRVTDGESPTYMLSLRWRGVHKFGGGYPVNPADGYMRFGDSIKAAPIAWLNGDGPFRFQPWYNEPMRIGGQQDLKLFLGQVGIGPSSFCAFQEHVLPDGEPVLATLIYTDKEGRQREADCTLDLRC